MTIWDAYYDRISPTCDATDSRQSTDIREQITGRFGSHAPSTLDVGCGTGKVLDMGITTPDVYTGVDPSQGMLNQLVRKYPTVHRLIHSTMEEALPTFRFGAFELVIAIASTHHLHPDTVAALPALSSAMTVIVPRYRGAKASVTYQSHANASEEETRPL